MLPVFHADNFKAWTPPFRTRPPSKHSRLHPPSNESPAIKLHHSPLPKALPLPKHQLPVRPPAEVCVHASAVTPSGTFRGPQSPPQKPSRLHSAKTTPATSSDTQHAERLEQSPRNRASPSSNPDLATSRKVHDAIDASIDAPFSPEDALRYISSPSVSSSDESWQEFLQPADEQNGIPIDPVILTNNGPWETDDERQHIHADGDSAVSETICRYPNPPPLLRDTLAENRNSSTCPESQEGNPRSDSPLNNQSHAQVFADNNPEAHIRVSSNRLETLTSGQQSKPRKRKLQQSHGQPQLCKRARGSSATVSKENSFSSLRSHFTSVSVDERLQFLSWLFEGALPRCVSESDPKEPDRVARPALRLLDQPADSTELYGTSRKGMPWSSEEANLLLRLRRDEKRTWSDVTRIFSEQFPGRSQGSIQVFWSSALKNRAH
ncbi:uncharacterized protein CDV56_103720 [Aspergillus thermomutatus]|uniref:Myb-like domain-containing protein n=1 Tax=Aspergillus thermomutatus TaxID=41047 RepID=A0A397GH29_ASPTH|nr:uncharacterized protein CDV56_103720 [Aspergillus thermomutatus]RHZ50302.1 hypothetical protein CDV56_103720 [Aspergillus thermomutatus]